MKHNFTSTGMAKIKNIDTIRAMKMQSTGSLIQCWLEYKMVQSLLENSLAVPYNKYLPYNPDIPPLVFTQEK